MTSSQKKIFRIIFFERPLYRFLIITFSILTTACGLALPYFQKLFSQTTSETYLIYCLLLSFGYLIFNQLTLYAGQYESVKTQAKLSEELYQHNIKLKNMALNKRSVGEIVSLYATDIPSVCVWLEQSVPYGLTTALPLLTAPLFLSYFYSIPMHYSLALIFLIVLANCWMAYRQSVFFFRFKILASERMGLVNEWIQNIRGLKILNWIEGFEKKIILKRNQETLNRIQMLNNGQVMNAVSSTTMFWINLCVLAFLIWAADFAVTKSDIIALLWITVVFLTRPLRQLPWFFTFVFDAWTSFKRLSDFLDIENQAAEIKNHISLQSDEVLSVKNLNLSINDRQILKHINLSIHKGEVVALIGPLGSGKSLLLKSFIGETSFSADSLNNKLISYLPQENFIMSASMRDNINFQYQSDIESDHLVTKHLSRAQFDFKKDRLTNGLNTLIGERGVNLSGGQKQRLALARQFSHAADLFLLDDPISAVDIETEKFLTNEFINLKNQGHSFLITTQRFSLLPFCDRIIYISNGEINFDGTYNNFIAIPKYQDFINGVIQ